MVIKRLYKFYAFYIFFVIQLFLGVIVPLHVIASGVDLEALEEVEEETKTIAQDGFVRLGKAIMSDDLTAVKKAIAGGDELFRSWYKDSHFTPTRFAIYCNCSHDIIQLLYENRIKNVPKEYQNLIIDENLLAFCLFRTIEKEDCAERIALLLKLGVIPPKDFADTLVWLWQPSLIHIDTESVSGVIQKRFANQNCGVVFDMLMRGKDRDIRDRATGVFKRLKQEEQCALKPYISFAKDYKAVLALFGGIGGSYAFTGFSRPIVSIVADFLVGEYVINRGVLPVCRAENGVEERRLLGRPSASLLASVALIKRCNKDEKREQEVAAAKKQLLEVETSQDFLVSLYIQENKILPNSSGCRYPLID